MKVVLSFSFGLYVRMFLGQITLRVLVDQKEKVRHGENSINVFLESVHALKGKQTEMQYSS